jgi:hypothetical protein
MSTLLTQVLDALLPGDRKLPRGSQIVDAATLQAAAEPVLQRLDAAQFSAAPDAALRDVEKAAPAEFRRLLDQALYAYYQAPEVLTAFGWRSDAPQPQGHVLASDDGETLKLLEQVRARGEIWRR